MVTSPKMSDYGEIQEIKQIEHENTKMYIKINKKGMTLFSPEALKNLKRGPKTPINGSLGFIESDFSRNNEGEGRYTNQFMHSRVQELSSPEVGFSHIMASQPQFRRRPKTNQAKLMIASR